MTDVIVRSPELRYIEAATSWSSRLRLVAAVVVYEILLSCTYIYFITPIFQYTGFVYHPLSAWHMLMIHAVGLVPAFWLSSEITRPSHIVEWFLFLLVFIPSCILPSYVLQQSALSLLVFDGVLLTSFGVLSFVSRLRWQK